MQKVMVAAALVATSCAGAHPQRLQWTTASPYAPARWWRFAAPDFVLETDLPETEGREAAESVQRELAVLRAMFGGAPPRPLGRVLVVVLESSRDYERHFGHRTSGLASTNAAGTRIFLYGSPSRWPDHTSVAEGAGSTLTHELAHLVLRQYFPVEPRWFSEGMAEYLEPYRWSEDRRRVEFGAVNIETYGLYRRHRSVGAADMFAWGDAVADESDRRVYLYGYSWALVHHLINERPKAFTEVMRRLANGNLEVADIIAPDGAAELDVAVHSYVTTGEYRVVVAEVPFVRQPATAAPMSGDDVRQVEQVLDETSQHFKGRASRPESPQP